MKNTKTILLQSLTAVLPIIYLLSVWNNLSERVPLHYNSKFEADDFGSKTAMLGLVVLMFVISIGTSLLMLNLNKIDPKKRYNNSKRITVKISWTIIVFMTLISGFIVYETEHYSATNASGFSPKYIVASIALLFAVIGNFMNNVKPNYFLGIRTPWTLEDEENWRLTHYLGSKIWFFGGLIMFVVVLFLPKEYISYVIGFSIIPLAVIPIFYSFYLFKQKQKKD